jgi:hypothetical protein
MPERHSCRCSPLGSHDDFAEALAASLRTLALIALMVISLVLIAFIVWLTMDGTEIPDLISR